VYMREEERKTAVSEDGRFPLPFGGRRWMRRFNRNHLLKKLPKL